MVAAGDQNQDKKLSREEMTALAKDWFGKLDAAGAGKISQADFTAKFASVLPAPATPAGGRAPGAPVTGRPGRGLPWCFFGGITALIRWRRSQ